MNKNLKHRISGLWYGEKTEENRKVIVIPRIEEIFDFCSPHRARQYSGGHACSSVISTLKSPVDSVLGTGETAADLLPQRVAAPQMTWRPRRGPPLRSIAHLATGARRMATAVKPPNFFRVDLESGRNTR